MTLLCIDVGNSFAHAGLVLDGHVLERCDIATALLAQGSARIADTLSRLAQKAEGAAWCSVVPRVNGPLAAILAGSFPARRVFHLTPESLVGLAIAYPHPAEVGQDRLANSVGAQKLCGTPVVAVCLGTASVIDVVSPRGYEGGAIAPGLAAFADYLHEKTAQLPRIDTADLATPSAVGRSTAEAMKIGLREGFAGMVKALVAAVTADLAADHGPVPVIVTGGGAHVLPQGAIPNARFVPDLGLIGLEEASRRAQNR